MAELKSTRSATCTFANEQLRARTAYRATSRLEGDRTWSDVVERAILREVARREQAHSAGESYPGTDGPLSPGRPVSGGSARPHWAYR